MKYAVCMGVNIEENIDSESQRISLAEKRNIVCLTSDAEDLEAGGGPANLAIAARKESPCPLAGE